MRYISRQALWLLLGLALVAGAARAAGPEVKDDGQFFSREAIQEVKRTILYKKV